MRKAPRTVDVSQSKPLELGELPSFISRQVSEARRYYFDLTPDPSAELFVMLGGWERVRADYSVHRPTFPYFCIEFVAEGQGNLVLDGEEHELSPGTVFVYGPDVPLSIEAKAPHLMTKYYVVFVGKHAKRLLDSVGLAPCGVRQMAIPPEVRELFDLLQRYGLSHTRFSQGLCASLIPTLLFKIAEQTAPHPATDARSLATYQELKRVLDEDFFKLKNIKQAAAMCRVSVPYACRLFHRFDHVTPYQYLMRHKMKYAADLLSHQGVLVKQVAKQLGFTDQYQFSRAFKRVFGLSPALFQQHVAPHAKEK
jgi:AraC-like DNA-binding protein